MASKKRRLPDWVTERLESLAINLCGPMVAIRVWNELLTSQDRRKLGNNLNLQFYKVGAALGIWMKLRGLSQGHAIVDLWDRLYGLVPDERRRLLAALGEAPSAIEPALHQGKPQWVRARGELIWNGKPVRRIRVMKQPSNIQLILDAFEAENWPHRIEDPLPDGPDAQRLHQTNFSLNLGLRVIRFHVQEAGRAVTWSVTTSPSTALNEEPLKSRRRKRRHSPRK